MHTIYIKKAADRFVKEHKIALETISSFKLLSAIAEKEAYKVYRFGSENDRVIHALGVEEFCLTNIAFTLHRKDMRYIFIRSDVPDNAAAKLLLHELAHIRLHHLDKRKTTASVSENDADVFVNYVRSRVCGNIKQVSNRNAIFAVCFAVVIICFDIYSKDTNNSVHSEDSAKLTVDVDIANTSTVYVTDTGDKYHKQNCYHLKDRHITALDIDIAESIGKEPCKDCFK